MRINPSTNLTGAIQITPGSQGTDTYSNVLTQRLVKPEIVDLLPFSETLARYVGKQEAEAKAIAAEEVETIGRRVESGDNLNDVLREYADSDLTPNQVKSKIAKIFNENGLDPATNPVYVQRFRKGQADIKSLVLRRNLLERAQIEEIAQAGLSDKSGQPYQAMLAALQTKLSGSNIYEGLEGIGSAAMNANLLGITQEVMETADERYRELVRQGSAEGFGATLLLAAEEFVAGYGREDSEIQDNAVRTIERAYAEQRLAGEPNARELLTDALLQVAREKGVDNPLAAAAFLDRAIELKEGDADVYGGDLTSRAKLAVEEQRMRDHAKTLETEKDYKEAVRRKEVFSELSSTFREELLYATRVGPEAVQQFFLDNQEKAVGMFSADEDKNAAADWWREQLQAANTTARTLDSSQTAVNAVRNELWFGDAARADQLLDEYRAGGLLSTEDSIELSREVANRRDNLFVYNIPDVKNFSFRIRDEIVNSGAFTKEGLNGPVVDSGKVLAATRAANRQFQEDLTEYIKSPAYVALQTLEEKDIAVQKWIGEKYDEIIDTLLPAEDKPIAARPLEESVKIEVNRARFAATSLKSLKGSAPEALGPLSTSSGPTSVKRIGSLLSRQKYADGYYNLLSESTQADTKGLDWKKASAGVDYIRSVLEVATDADLKDANGNAVNDFDRAQAVGEALAYGGLLSIDDILSINSTAKVSQESQEKWNFTGVTALDIAQGLPADYKRRKAPLATDVTSQLGKYLQGTLLSLRGVDPMRVRLPEVGNLLLSVTKDEAGQPSGIKKSAENKDQIEKVRGLLSSMGLEDDDTSVALFIYHQYQLTKQE